MDGDRFTRDELRFLDETIKRCKNDVEANGQLKQNTPIWGYVREEMINEGYPDRGKERWRIRHREYKEEQAMEYEEHSDHFTLDQLIFIKTTKETCDREDGLTWGEITDRFILKFGRNVTVYSVKTLYNKRLRGITIGELKKKTNTLRPNQFTVREMLFIKKTKENVQMTSSDSEESSTSEDEQNQIENHDANLISWNEIVQKFNRKFGSNKTLSSLKSLYNKRLKSRSVKNIKKFPPSRADQLSTKQMIYLKNVKEYGVQDDDDDEDGEQSDREEEDGEQSDQDDEQSDREEQLTWRKITSQFNEKFKCNKKKSALKTVYLRRLKDNTIDEIKEYAKSANNVITEDVKRELVRFATGNKNPNKEEIMWQNVDQVVPNASAKWAFKLHSHLKCDGQLARFSTATATATTTAADQYKQFDDIIEPIVRRTDERTKNEILRLINDENMYYTDAAEQLGMNTEQFVKLYNALMVHCTDRCEYTHCIRLFKSDDEPDVAKIEHVIKTHRSTNSKAFEIGRKKITAGERDLIQQLKVQHNTNPPFDCITYFVFDYAFARQCHLVEDLIRGLLNSDAYIGQSQIAIRPVESVMSAQTSTIFNTTKFKDERIREMIEPAYIIIEKDLSVNLSKVIETSAINTPLRNLLNVKKTSIDDVDLNSSQSILLKKYVIKTLVHKLINGDFVFIDKEAIKDYISYFVEPFAEQLKEHFTGKDKGNNKFYHMRTMNIIMNESKQHPFVSCEKCKLRFIKKDHYYCYKCGSKTSVDDEEAMSIVDYQVVHD